MEEKTKVCDCCGEEDCDCENEEIVELVADDGRKLKFYFIGTLDYNDKIYAAFEPAEEIDGVDTESVVIFELANPDSEEDSELLPITDEKLLDEVYNAFVEAMAEDDDCDCDEEGCDCHHHDHN